MSAKRQQHSVHSLAKISSARRRLFIAISLLLPVLALAGIELMLRLFDIGGHHSILKKMDDTPYGRLVVTDISGVQNFFHANPERPGSIGQHSFYTPKQTGTVRIVLLGGSMIKGYPQTRRFAMSSFLKEMLSDAWTERNVEVINLGTTAVASFPVHEFLKQALEYEPDLVVVATGHNEFYGAYGVASSNKAGSSPAMLKLQYHLNGVGIVQGLTQLLHTFSTDEHHSMMETMVGQNYVKADSWKREAAARLLYEHLASMIETGREKNVPVIVCTLPSNERDLAPIGAETVDSDEADIITQAKDHYRKIPGAVINKLTALLKHRPNHAHAHYYLGKAYFASGNYRQAQHHFVQARNLDPMPWRATSASQFAIRRAAAIHGTQLCEAEDTFRKHSPGGATGWELMDDHVHPSLAGQSLLARTIVETLTARTDSLRVPKQRFDSLPDWSSYARQLGDNPYEHYAVAHTLRMLYTVPFMEQSNPDALHRFNKFALRLESQMAPEIREIAWQWQKDSSRNNTWQPISGMVAHGMLKQNRYQEALALFEVARHSVFKYSKLNLEYVYYWLSIRKKLYGELSDADRTLTTQAINRGGILLQYDDENVGEIEKYIEGLQKLIR
jgi:lysophospholipase L1-like esterase